MKTGKVSFCAILWLLAGSMPALSVPSYPHYVRIAVGTGSVNILLQGDEHCKHAVTEEGFTLLPKEDGWYYATKDYSGIVIPSEHKLACLEDMSEATSAFLSQTPKGLQPQFQQTYSPLYSPTDTGAVPSRAPVVGFRKALIILMQFRDKALTKEKADFDKLFNKENYTDDGAMGSVYDYYQWASYGQLDLKSDVIGPYKSKYDMSYYGGNGGVNGSDKNPYALFEEALNYAINDISLSDYDADGDGYVDNIHIIYAGYGEEAGAPSDAIWAHEMTFRSITVQGMKINKYSCAPELRGNRGTGISRIGPHCHEIGHALGAMDYYDTNYETGGSFLGTGYWDIMASGSWNNDGISPADFNPYVKIYNFGWTEAQTLTEDEENTIRPSSEKGNIYRIDTGTKDDFFLLDNRDGKIFNAAEPGQGLLIFHCGPQLATKAESNTINATYPQQCYVVCASSSYKKPSSSASSYGSINSASCPYPGISNRHAFTDETIPAAFTVSGQSTGISLTNITNNGDDITLFCGINGSIPPDQDPVYSWSEDFEERHVPTGWEYQDAKGKGELSVIAKLADSDTPLSPSAATGQSYLKFNGASQSIIGRYRTEGLLTTSTIKLNPDKRYLISVKTRKYSRLDEALDSLSIGLVNNEGGITEWLFKKEVKLQKQWEEFSTSLPEGVYEFSLAIDFNIDYGTLLFVDDIRITEYSDDTSIKLMQRDAVNTNIYYTLDGRRTNATAKGLFIMRMPDGSYRKVHSKSARL